MTVEEHTVDAAELFVQCSRCGRLGLELPTACTCINFRTNRAVIWLIRGAAQETIEHERAHGRGYDHHDGGLRSRYVTWKEGGGRRTATPGEPIHAADIKLSRTGQLKSEIPHERAD